MRNARFSATRQDNFLFMDETTDNTTDNFGTMTPERSAFEAGRQATRDALKKRCAAIFSEPCAITLEIGSGHGHFLAAYGEAHPDEICVGIDLITKRVKKGENKRDKRGLEKLLFLKAEALEFLDALPDHVTIAKTFVLFPDPWPKTRHWKHRIVQQPLLEKLAKRTTPGALLFLRTDHTGYFEWMNAEIASNPHWEKRADLPWPFESPSFFQNLMESWQSMVVVRTDR
jgi:tRNA (guanine-N7-)-methyltransferase